MLLKQYAKSGQQWAFQRDDKTFATCVVLETTDLFEDPEGYMLWEATLLIGDQIVHIYAPWKITHDETAPFYIFMEADGEFFHPKDVDLSYMIPLELVEA